jgi:hypothetical protein
MKIDDQWRKFFASMETLERLDQLHEAADAYVNDLAPRVLTVLNSAIRTRVGKSLQATWKIVEDRLSPDRFLGITRNPALLRVEFGYRKKDQYGEFPCSPWIGIWASAGLNFDKIFEITRVEFSKPLKEPSYAIYERIDNWPDLYNGSWVDLHPVCSDGGKAISAAIAAQIVAIARSLDENPACFQPPYKPARSR